MKDQADINLPKKEYYLALTDVPTRLKVRELSTEKVGTLIRISGQVRIENLFLYSQKFNRSEFCKFFLISQLMRFKRDLMETGFKFF